jgi:hypothetical protein
MVRASRVLRSACGVAAFATIAIAACDNPFTSESTEVRLRNASAFELTAVTFQPGGPKLEFARIAAGETTPYTSARGAYRYCFLDALVGGERRVIQPTDYVGEEVIDGGRYTYVITADATTRNPAVQLIRDD